MNAISTVFRYPARPCPVCGEPATRRREVHSAPRAEALSFAEVSRFWVGLLTQKVFFSYARCSACGLLYAPAFFDEVQLARLYGRMPPNMEMVPLAALRRTQRGYFEALKSRGRPRGSYLEVGPDIGLFVENCVREDAFDHHWLLEPNRSVAKQLGEAMRGRPHTIVESMFGFDRVPDESVGAAVMVHVLDHLVDPISTLTEVRRKMAPGGVILLVTHDESSLLRRLGGKRWPPFCLQHPQLFNPATLASVLNRTGFKDVTVSRSVNHFSLAFLVRHVLWVFGAKVPPRLPQAMNFSVGVKLGNMIALATA